MDIVDRLKQIRKEKELNQTEFGKRVGVSRDVIKNIECRNVSPKELFIDSICKEYHVIKRWLLTGEGEQYNEAPEYIIEELSLEYKLDDYDKKIIIAYLSLDENERKIIKKMIDKIK